MRVGVSGLGSTITDLNVPQCGDNPCSWYDNVYLTDGCLSYLQCADPTNLLVTGAVSGAGTMIGQAVGQVTTGVVTGAAGGVGNTVGLNGALVLAAAAAVLLVVAMKR